MYLSGVSNADLIGLRRSDVGLMIQPGNGYLHQAELYPWFAADNGCFNAKWEYDHWRKWLDEFAYHNTCLFAVVPDVVCDHTATLERWYQYRDDVTHRGLPTAFVAQNGCTPDDVPPEADAVFIGGDTHWKLSEDAWLIVTVSKAHGKHVHVGRVNSFRRLRACALSGADSADGTYLKWGPDINLPKLTGWLDWVNTHQPLQLFGPTT